LSYTEWLKNLEKLPKTAEFCLADITEQISAGGKTLNFRITEALGEDLDPNGRRGQKKKVCRPRIYTSGIVQVEITEPFASFAAIFKGSHGFSLHDFYLSQSRLCESVLSSLTEKIALISERSAALLESQLGDEVVKLITKRLEGEEVEESTLKSLLISQLTSLMFKHVVRPVKRVNGWGVKVLEIEEKDTTWEYHAQEGKVNFIALKWKNIKVAWLDSEPIVEGDAQAICARDAFLFIVNLPTLGQMIVYRLAKLMDQYDTKG
jgi:hypothetical protein